MTLPSGASQWPMPPTLGGFGILLTCEVRCKGDPLRGRPPRSLRPSQARRDRGRSARLDVAGMTTVQAQRGRDMQEVPRSRLESAILQRRAEVARPLPWSGPSTATRPPRHAYGRMLVAGSVTVVASSPSRMKCNTCADSLARYAVRRYLRPDVLRRWARAAGRGARRHRRSPEHLPDGRGRRRCGTDQRRGGDADGTEDCATLCEPPGRADALVRGDESAVECRDSCIDLCTQPHPLASYTTARRTSTPPCRSDGRGCAPVKVSQGYYGINELAYDLRRDLPWRQQPAQRRETGAGSHSEARATPRGPGPPARRPGQSARPGRPAFYRGCRG